MGVRSFTEYGNGPLGFGGVYGWMEGGACSALEAAIAPPRNEIEQIVFLYIGNRGVRENIGHQVIMLGWRRTNAPSARILMTQPISKICTRSVGKRELIEA